MQICDLQEDIDNVRRRLDGRPPPSPEAMREERTRRWERTLALVEAAFGQRR
jgi:hypothetical protein